MSTDAELIALVAEARSRARREREYAVTVRATNAAVDAMAVADLIDRLASALEAARAGEWRMMTHTDEERAMLFERGSFLAAIEYRKASTGDQPHWQIDTISLDDETGEVQQDTGWILDDYTHWCPLPSPPAIASKDDPNV